MNDCMEPQSERRGRPAPAVPATAEPAQGRSVPLQGLHHVHPKHPATLSVGKGGCSVPRNQMKQGLDRQCDTLTPPSCGEDALWQTAVAACAVTCGQSLAREKE